MNLLTIADSKQQQIVKKWLKGYNPDNYKDDSDIVQYLTIKQFIQTKNELSDKSL